MASIIQFKQKGDFSKTESFLKKLRKLDLDSVLDKYGKLGVDALSKATPVDTGKTAASWDYKIEKGKGVVTITWTNSNVNNGVPIAINTVRTRHRNRRLCPRNRLHQTSNSSNL